MFSSSALFHIACKQREFCREEADWYCMEGGEEEEEVGVRLEAGGG